MNRRALDLAFYAGLLLLAVGLSLAVGLGWGLTAVGAVLLVAATMGAMRS